MGVQATAPSRDKNLSIYFLRTMVRIIDKRTVRVLVTFLDIILFLLFGHPLYKKLSTIMCAGYI